MVGETKYAGFEFGIRRTFDIPLAAAWKFIISKEGQKIWLANCIHLEKGILFENNGITGEVRVVEPESHVRITWKAAGWEKASTIQIRILPNGHKTTIAFHQENLPGAKDCKEAARYWQDVMRQFEKLLS